MKYGTLTLDQISNLIDKIGGMAAVEKILSEKKPIKEAREFEIWKKVRIGTGFKSSRDIRRALRAAGCGISQHANKALGSKDFKINDSEIELDLVRVSTNDLGLDVYNITYEDIRARAEMLGLEVCPSEVGPQLCLQYNAQTGLDRYTDIFMQPVTYIGSNGKMFSVGSSKNRVWLESSSVSQASPLLDSFVFVKPRL